MKKQYIGFIRDHSGSMFGLREQARVDYNRSLETHQYESRVRDFDTIATVIEVGKYPTVSFGYKREFARAEVNTSIARLKPLSDYETPGGSTPLFDALNDLIDVLETAPDAKEKDTAFLVMVITDGYENVSPFTGPELGKRIRKLQDTDRWTFTFRVPFGHADALARMLNIPAGNILEWEQTRQGFERATVQTVNSTQAYYGTRDAGFTSSKTFYANPADLTKTEVKRNMEDISREVDFLKVKSGGNEIKPFVEKQGRQWRIGAAFYQLTKPESKVQDYKQLAIRDKVNGKVYAGSKARALLGLPIFGDIKLSPGDHGKWDVFVQSTSVNRKLIAGTEVMYWDRVRF